ncbi:MAG: hypothetical protein WBG57_13680 [Ornithinimicrobium sp.]
MSTLQEINHDVATMSRTHAGARLLIVVSGVVFAAALQAGTAGMQTQGVPTPGLGLAAGFAMIGVSLLSAWHPHSLMPFLTMGFLILNWAVLMPGAWSPWLLPAALALLLLHTSAAVCATVPAQAPIPRALWSLNSLRVAAVAALTTVIWLIAAVIGEDPPGTGLTPAFVGFSVLLGLLWLHYRAYVAPQAAPATR